MADSAAIEQRVQEITAQQLNVEKDKVVPSASFAGDLGADSLDLVELVMEFESEFDVQIPDAEAENIQTVQQAIDYIKAHMEG